MGPDRFFKKEVKKKTIQKIYCKKSDALLYVSALSTHAGGPALRVLPIGEVGGGVDTGEGKTKAKRRNSWRT